MLWSANPVFYVNPRRNGSWQETVFLNLMYMNLIRNSGRSISQTSQSLNVVSSCGDKSDAHNI
jgi:hypothetical protein